VGIVNDVLIIDTLKLGSSLLHGKGIWVVRKIVFGAGDECKKILPHIKGRISFVVDNNEDKWGTDILGTEIKSPEEINEDDEIYIATSPRYVHEIVDMLSIRGLHNIKMARSLEKGIYKAQNNDVCTFKNKYYGKSCVIIGTGSSLRVCDLERIKKAGLYTFASNKIFKIFVETTWRPDFYCVTDSKFISQYFNEICDMEAREIFINNVPELPWCMNPHLFSLEFDGYISKDRKFVPVFSEDASEFVNEGMTVTYAMLQLAYYMGFKEMYLLGIDFSYEDMTGMDYEKNDHFCKDYIKKGEIVNPPDLRTNLLAYQEAERFSRAHGFRIYNATRGGKLEVFERVDFDKLMENFTENQGYV